VIIASYEGVSGIIYGVGFPPETPNASALALHRMEVSLYSGFGILQIGYLQGASYPSDAEVVSIPATTTNGPAAGDLGLRVFSTESAVLHGPITSHLVQDEVFTYTPPERLAGYDLLWTITFPSPSIGPAFFNLYLDA
jgi:hypothetical protein